MTSMLPSPLSIFFKCALFLSRYPGPFYLGPFLLGVNELAFLLVSQSYSYCPNCYTICFSSVLASFCSYDYSLLVHHLSYPQVQPRKAALSITTDPASSISPVHITHICLIETNSPDFVVCYFRTAFPLTPTLVKYLNFHCGPIFSSLLDYRRLQMKPEHKDSLTH